MNRLIKIVKDALAESQGKIIARMARMEDMDYTVSTYFLTLDDGG